MMEINVIFFMFTLHLFQGQEIFNTYGKLANCDLLKSYGFIECELPNKYDMVSRQLHKDLYIYEFK